MIFDKVSEYKTYLGISEELDVALKLMAETDFSAAENGKYEVCDGVYYMIFDGNTKPYAEAKWEAHREYIDIHVPLIGAEKDGVRHISELKESTPYDADMDVLFYTSDSDKELYTVNKGQFMLVFPADGHVPMVAVDEPAYIKKMVIKVKA